MRFGGFLRASVVAMRNILVGGNLVSLSLWRQPRRMLSYINEVLFLYRGFTGSHGLSQRNVYQVLPASDTVSIQIGSLRSRDSGGGTWFDRVPSHATDIISLCLLAQILKPRVVFEIGTLRGYTALHFALNTPEESHVYTLDLPQDQPLEPRLETTLLDAQHIAAHGAAQPYHFHGTPVEHKITCLFGDSAAFDFSPYYEQVDLFFIDGAHSYEYVRSDTLNALKCCHTGSVVAWHDFGRMGVNGVSRWLREFSAENRIYSVPGGSLAFMVLQ